MIIDNVEAAIKRQWVWTNLMKKAEEIAKEEWIERIELGAYPQDDSIDSESLKNFYEKLWFEVNDYTDAWEWIYYDMSKRI